MVHVSKKKAKSRKASDALEKNRSKKTKTAGALEHFRLFLLSRPLRGSPCLTWCASQARRALPRLMPLSVLRKMLTRDRQYQVSTATLLFACLSTSPISPGRFPYLFLPQISSFSIVNFSAFRCSSFCPGLMSDLHVPWPLHLDFLSLTCCLSACCLNHLFAGVPMDFDSEQLTRELQVCAALTVLLSLLELGCLCS
jgi:hypothetical protein